MNRLLLPAVMIAVLVGGATMLHSADARKDRCEERPLVCRMIKARLGEVSPAERVNPPGAQELRYGDDARQTISYWQARGANIRAPLVVFIHGGGWTRGDKSNATGPAKISWLVDQGYDVASLDYRLVPSVEVGDQARDVAAAIRYLRSRASDLGFDADRIVIMGHSAGAHLAALVGTDDSYLGGDLAAVRGVVLLDGAGYDLARQLKEAGSFEAGIYAQPFGSLSAARLTELSPTAHVEKPNAGAFMILYDAQRETAVSQSTELGEGLKKAGTIVEMMPVANSTHIGINFDLGKAGHPETVQVAAFLSQIGVSPAL